MNDNKDKNPESAIDALASGIARWTDKIERYDTAVPGFSLFRREEPTAPAGGMYEPSICMVAQGAKRVILGDDTYVYDAQHYLITSVHLPTVVQILEASREKPCLGLMLKLDPRELSQLMADSDLPPPRTQQSSRGMATGKMTLPLLTAFQRLIDLLDEPADIPILSPIIQREIIYRLLVGDQGARLRQIASAGSQSHRIARAIDWLKSNFAQPLRIDDLAGQASMSSSTFHHHFRSMTALSPPAIPEAAALAGSQAPHDGRTSGSCDRGIPGRLRKPFTVQPRIQPPVRGTSVAGRHELAENRCCRKQVGSPGGLSWLSAR